MKFCQKNSIPKKQKQIYINLIQVIKVNDFYVLNIHTSLVLEKSIMCFSTWASCSFFITITAGSQYLARSQGFARSYTVLPLCFSVHSPCAIPEFLCNAVLLTKSRCTGLMKEHHTRPAVHTLPICFRFSSFTSCRPISIISSIHHQSICMHKQADAFKIHITN